MVNQIETLARLNKEKNYEDKLAEDLINYYIDCLDSVKELTESERNIAKENLGIILSDTQQHRFLFEQLMEMVLENGEDNY